MTILKSMSSLKLPRRWFSSAAGTGPSPGGEFFSHERFWSDRTNTGPFFIALIAAPFLYKGVKSGYYALRYKSVNRAEIISDRYSWLHERMLEDEVDAALIEKWKRRRRSN
eukprot:GHVU01183154.1.p1 GENE.GHVU01183154.1~~GHVU01183154.1.p1  ORF type:complete len:111 (-),score=16.58 GHVU01183154.1:145-477(-)